MDKTIVIEAIKKQKKEINEKCKGKIYTQFHRPPKSLFREPEDTRTVTETAGVRSTFDRIMAVKRAGIILDNYRKEHYDINPGSEREDYIRLFGLETMKTQAPDVPENVPTEPKPEEKPEEVKTEKEG